MLPIDDLWYYKFLAALICQVIYMKSLPDTDANKDKLQKFIADQHCCRGNILYGLFSGLNSDYGSHSSLGLTSIPPCIGNLTFLTSLIFSDFAGVIQLPKEIGHLKHCYPILKYGIVLYCKKYHLQLDY